MKQDSEISCKVKLRKNTSFFEVEKLLRNDTEEVEVGFVAFVLVFRGIVDLTPLH